MLEDMHVVVSELASVSFQVRKKKKKRTNKWGGKKKKKNLFPPGIEPGTLRVWGARDNHYTTETSLRCGHKITGFVLNIHTDGWIKKRHRRRQCHVWLSHLWDEVKLNKLSLYISLMYLTSHRDSLTIQFLIPHELLAQLPDEGIRQGEPIRVVPVLFTQGVNEKQTFANIRNEWVGRQQVNGALLCIIWGTSFHDTVYLCWHQVFNSRKKWIANPLKSFQIMLRNFRSAWNLEVRLCGYNESAIISAWKCLWTVHLWNLMIGGYWKMGWVSECQSWIDHLICEHLLVIHCTLVQLKPTCIGSYLPILHTIKGLRTLLSISDIPIWPSSLALWYYHQVAY